MNVNQWFYKHSPDIIKGAAVLAFAGAAVLAAKAAPEVRDILEEEKPDSLAEKVKLALPHYAPAIGSFALGCGLVIFARHMDGQRYAALGAAYSASTMALEKWKQAAADTLSKKKFEEVRRETLKPDPKLDIEDDIIMLSDDPRVLFWDDHTKRPFWHKSVDAIRLVEKEVQKLILSEDFVSLNEYYQMIGLEPLGVHGDNLGWGTNEGRADFGLIFDAFVLEDKSVAPIVVSFLVDPEPRTYF